MKARFHDAAQVELAEAVDYYDEKTDGLGGRLLAEIRAATRRIEQYPEIAPEIDHAVRGKVLSTFPYTLMYVIDPDELFIVAVAHHSKNPGYWVDRLPTKPRA